MARTMPQQKPHRSRQDYRTPKDFLIAVEARFGSISIDLAATRKNTVVPSFISPKENSLSVAWELEDQIAWLNPDFKRLSKWSEKCYWESKGLGPRGAILLLSPASIGSCWFDRYVWGTAEVYALKGRLTFVGEKTPYPKDCILSVYKLYSKKFFDVWDWREEKNVKSKRNKEVTSQAN